MKTALVFGSSGLVGGHLLSQLIENDDYNKLKIFVRSEPEINDPKVEIIKTDFNNLENHKKDIKGDDCFFCIGTTKQNSPDKNEYKTSIDETHHVHKDDKPSGTAITLAKDIISDSRYRDWKLDSNTEDKININSLREKEVNGVHKVTYSSENDIISIKHEALNRKGFALGAVISAEWLVNKKGCFSISDMLIMG